jgi:DNA-binding transcriptional LysR family regulator
MLDVRRLRLLRELHARGTIAAVADALSYTPSAVSQQLSLLERQAGVQLLERVGRRVRITDAGLRLVEHTEAILTRLEQAEADLDQAAGAVRGTVRVASFQTAAQALVAPALTALAEHHPEVRCELQEMDPENSLPLLRLGELDLVVAEEYEHTPRRRDPGLERRRLCRDPVLLALHRDHPAARNGKPVRLADLAGERWAGGERGTLFADFLLKVCRERGDFEPDVRHHVDDIRILTQLAALGMAVTFIPSLGRHMAQSNVALRPVAGPPLDRLVFTAVRQGSAARPSVGAVLRAVRDAAVALDLPGVEPIEEGP